MVRVDTDHGGMGCFVINNLGMPQATQGSFYSFQSFFEEKSKKGFTLLSLTQNPQPQKKICRLSICPRHLNPMAQMPV